MCGFVGIVGRQDCAADILLGLQALQHRGQDAAGVGTVHKGSFPIKRRSGLVAQNFGPEEIEQLPGVAGIGHVRYPTLGSGTLRDAQPFFFRQPGVLMAHNGNFISVRHMQEYLADESVHLMSRCDMEPVLCIFSLELMRIRRKNHTVDDALIALRNTFRHAQGAYSLVGTLVLDGEESLMAVRDPLGIRPAVWGRRNGSIIVASESVALDALNAKLEGDIPPGDLMVFRPDGSVEQHNIHPGKSAPCIFEYIYFARPDSIMNGASVYSVRLELGRKLARSWKTKGLQADVVIPIPDTSRPSANALAEELGLPFREGFIKNRYTGRTFIMQTAERTDALRLKLNPIRSEFTSRSVLLVDDSIVRGSTLQRTIQLVRDQGVRAVHLAIHSPPVVHPCYYGIDMSTYEELAAPAFRSSPREEPPTQKDHQEIEERLAARLGVDSLTYLPLSGLKSAFTHTCCAACFDGNYPLPISDEARKWIETDRNTCRTATGYQQNLIL
jgi:amidophosphoribosyltransferase